MDKLKVLVVDDDNDVRDLMTIWLKEKYDVDTAVDGNDCLAKIKKNKYDIIFLDVMMPGPRPAELVPSITSKLPNVRIIYLTAVEMFNPTPEQEKKGFQPIITPNVKGYLVKPVDKEMVINKINEVMEMEKLLKPKTSSSSKNKSRGKKKTP